MRICLIPGCTCLAAERGLCIRCFAAAQKLVDSGREDWSTLIRLELALPLGPSESPFTKVFSGAVYMERKHG